MLVYSVTSRRSLDTITTYVNRIKLWCKSNPLIILVANQADLIQSREVSYIEGVKLASEIGAQYSELSVADDVDSVISLFQDLYEKLSGDAPQFEESRKRKTQKLINYFRRRGST